MGKRTSSPSITNTKILKIYNSVFGDQQGFRPLTVIVSAHFSWTLWRQPFIRGRERAILAIVVISVALAVIIWPIPVSFTVRNLSTPVWFVISQAWTFWRRSSASFICLVIVILFKATLFSARRTSWNESLDRCWFCAVWKIRFRPKSSK